jgi:hypothetical protein
MNKVNSKEKVNNKSIPAAVNNSIRNDKFMHVDVILTFKTLDSNCERQEHFSFYLSVRKREKDAISFLDREFFASIAAYCEQVGRNVRDLCKISTASNWSLFSEVTGKISLYDMGHCCKWYFGVGRDDLDNWEKTLMCEYGFGLNCDMSWVGDPELTQISIANKLIQFQEFQAQKQRDLAMML